MGRPEGFAQVGTTTDILTGVVTDDSQADMLRLHCSLTASVVTVNLLRGIGELVRTANQA